MQCRGNFVFKTFTHRQAGTFKNAEGEELSYPATYLLKVDEIGEDGSINERTFKVPEDKTVLINELSGLEAYQKIILDFKVTIYTTRISLEVVDVGLA